MAGKLCPVLSLSCVFANDMFLMPRAALELVAVEEEEASCEDREERRDDAVVSVDLNIEEEREVNKV